MCFKHRKHDVRPYAGDQVGKPSRRFIGVCASCVEDELQAYLEHQEEEPAEVQEEEEEPPAPQQRQEQSTGIHPEQRPVQDNSQASRPDLLGSTEVTPVADPLSQNQDQAEGVLVPCNLFSNGLTNQASVYSNAYSRYNRAMPKERYERLTRRMPGYVLPGQLSESRCLWPVMVSRPQNSFAEYP